MTIEYTPVGIACNLGCDYCYQQPMRDAGNITTPRNWPKVKKILTRYDTEFAVFGGEPLLAPIEHLEEVWQFGFERYGQNSVQTNGALITDEHIALFRKYNVGVGISIDGPGKLNALRPSNNPGIDTTQLTMANITKLCAFGIAPSLIITIHPVNAGDDRLLELLTWLDTLEQMGVKYINFHILEVEKGKEKLSFTEEENIDVFTRLYLWSKASKMQVEPFTDIYKLLTEENPNVSCVWNHCDPLTTAAVQGIGPDGSRSNCGRTNKDGINWEKGDSPGFERYLLLHQTPQEYGGCKDCKFFVFCKGQCPGTAIDGDWRNRTRDCKTWYALFERIEADILREMRLPISRNTELLKKIEKQYVTTWSGDHADVPHGDVPHGDIHGDSPHGDIHIDGIPGVFLNEPPEFFTS